MEPSKNKHPITAKLIRDARLRSGLQPQDFISQNNLNMNETTLSRWETGMAPVPVDVLIKLGLISEVSFFSHNIRSQFTKIITSIKQSRQELEDASPDWPNVSTFKLVGTVRDYAIANFEAARKIFDSKVTALENLQQQIDELRDQLKKVQGEEQ